MNQNFLLGSSNLHVMIDLETLGTSPDSTILSIGAVAKSFGTFPAPPKEFYKVPSIKSQVDSIQSQLTIDWWNKQSPEARAVLSESQQTQLGICEALLEFKIWFLGLGLKENIYVWSNGADFDLPMISWAFGHYLGMQPPWHYQNSRCFRTAKAMLPKVEVPKIGVAHNALDDAKWQMAYLGKAAQAARF